MHDATVSGQIMVLDLSRFRFNQIRQISCVPAHGLSRKRRIWSWNGAYHRGTNGSPALGYRRVKSWRIFGMLRTRRQQLRPKQPTAYNPYPTRIEGYIRRSRATSGLVSQAHGGYWVFEGNWEENTGEKAAVVRSLRTVERGPPTRGP
jgi:hypothetical protein